MADEELCYLSASARAITARISSTGDSYVDRPLTINGKPQADIAEWLMTAVFNILGRCPVMSVPSGFASTGVPTGLAIVGRTFDDVSVFRAAAAFEQARPWLDKAERRPRL